MDRGWHRVLDFLRPGPADCGPAARPGGVLLSTPAGGTIATTRALLEELAAADLIVRDESTVRLAAGDPAEPMGDPLGARRRLVEMRADAPATAPVAVNAAESPLALLTRLRTKAGAPFLTAAEFHAGERLRTDFSRGSLMPRLGANWEASVASDRRHGGSGGVADLSDSALAARMRVERALAAVGPELAGVLVDVCCFLKGLEQVESERGWPVRSAKLMLKSALAALARFYDPAPRSPKRDILHWGVADYRPKAG